MTVRGSHYETAFEAYLNRRGVAFVAVEDVRHLVKGGLGCKVFDYIVYPTGGQACLVDVKGRKCSAGQTGECRQKSWVTRADVTGLLAWEGLFGREFVGAFVFVYWLAGAKPTEAPDSDGAGRSIFAFAGRRYSFWLVPVAVYASHQKRLSQSWDTVAVPREAFHSISRPLATVWPAAPC